MLSRHTRGVFGCSDVEKVALLLDIGQQGVRWLDLLQASIKRFQLLVSMITLVIREGDGGRTIPSLPSAFQPAHSTQ